MCDCYNGGGRYSTVWASNLACFINFNYVELIYKIQFQYFCKFL